MRRFYGLMTAIVLAIVVTGYAQEKLTLTQAVFVDTGATEFRVSSLYLNRQGSEIRAIFTEVVPGTTTFVTNGRVLACAYNGTTADSFLLALNKMNFSVTSLEKRVTTQCQTDGKLGAGSVTGTPQ
jgi:hypothetical protein